MNDDDDEYNKNDNNKDEYCLSNRKELHCTSTYSSKAPHPHSPNSSLARVLLEVMKLGNAEFHNSKHYVFVYLQISRCSSVAYHYLNIRIKITIVKIWRNNQNNPKASKIVLKIYFYVVT